MAKRALSVAAILERRRCEDDALRAAIAQIDTDIEALKAQRAELARALGVQPTSQRAQGAPPADTGPRAMQCIDCGATVTVAANAEECPACQASPFEGA